MLQSNPYYPFHVVLALPSVINPTQTVDGVHTDMLGKPPLAKEGGVINIRTMDGPICCETA